jgi:outer membrane protein assembly factor BamB
VPAYTTATPGAVDTDGERYYVLRPPTLTAYSEDGAQLWKFSATFMALGATAVLAADSTYLYSLYRDTGTVIWSVPLSSYSSQLQCSSGTFYAKKHSSYYAFTCSSASGSVTAAINEQGVVVNKVYNSQYWNIATNYVIAKTPTSDSMIFINETSVITFPLPVATSQYYYTIATTYSNGWIAIANYYTNTINYAMSPDLSQQMYLLAGYGVAPSCFNYFSRIPNTFACADGEILGTNAFGFLCGFNALNELKWYTRTAPATLPGGILSSGLLARSTAAMLVADGNNGYNLCVVVR